MREALCLALAKYRDQPLTLEVARSLVDDLFPAMPIDPAQFEPRQCGSVVFAVERFADVMYDLVPIHSAHWRETEGHRHHLSLDPDYHALLEEDRSGTLLQIIARRDGAIVGHVRLYLRQSRHTKTMLAVEDTLYLAPEVRGGRTAKRMVEYSEDVLRRLGVTHVEVDSKLVNRASRFMEGCGYRPVATKLVKFLSEPGKEN